MKVLIVLSALLASLGTVAGELSPASRVLIDQISNGGPASIRQAAQTIERSGERDTRVLDVLAESLLQNYRISNNTNIDAMAWACKALASSGNPRYYTAVKTVADSDEARKLRKHCDNAADDLDAPQGEQYALGMAATVTAATASSPSATAASAPVAAKPASFSPISEVKIGMSMEQAYALAGQPTATTSYETGKRWVPFNFKGGDVSRTAALYKGQGRIVFSNNSAYSSGMSVAEVQLDANEKGYP